MGRLYFSVVYYKYEADLANYNKVQCVSNVKNNNIIYYFYIISIFIITLLVHSTVLPLSIRTVRFFDAACHIHHSQQIHPRRYTEHEDVMIPM